MGTQHTNPVAASVARVIDTSGEVVGAGFVVGPHQIATCAHVVSAVLGGRPEDPAAPTGRLRVELPLLRSPHTSDAVVRAWRPIDGATGVGDVAILELAAALPDEARVPPLYRPERLWGHRFRVLGFPAWMQDGVWTGGELLDRQGTRWLQLQSDERSPPITQGFSGAPVWDEEVEAVVGMTVASDVRPESTTAYLLPIEDVLGVDLRLLPNPYRGLEPFGEEHADVFYGREDEVVRLEALLSRRPLVTVVGRSGTGKSSLVRAGLLPRLRRRGVRVVEFRPRPADAGAAAVALDRLADQVATLLATEPRRDVVLFADQFEELVGRGPASEEPTPAQDCLRRLVRMVRDAPRHTDGAPALRVVLTLRWEAMNELLTDDVAETFDQGTFSLPAMSRDQLRRAVVGPTARAPGLDFDPGLVERILDDAVAEPGQLSLVESLLTQLWESRRGGTLTMSAYERLGGVKGAVTRHAEQAVGQLVSADDEMAVRQLLTMLARPDDSTGFVRQPVLLEGLSADQQQIVERLARTRILVVGQEADGTHTVELAHQALIDHWPRFQGWLDKDRDFLLWQHEVDRQRQTWERGGRDQGALLRGMALLRASEWSQRRDYEVSPSVRGFVEASAAADIRQRRRTRLVRAGLGAAAALALVLGTVAVQQRRVAQEEQAISSSRDLATLAADTAATDPALSILLTLEAHQRHATPEAEEAIFRHYLDYLNADTVLSGAPGQIEHVDVSSDGRVIAARTSLGNVTLWTREPGRPVSTRQIDPPLAFDDAAEQRQGDSDNQALAIALSDDGRSLLVLGRRAWVYDVETGDLRGELAASWEDIGWFKFHGEDFVLFEYPGQTASRLELWDVGEGRPRRVGELSLPPTISIRSSGPGPLPDTVVLDIVDDADDPEPTGELPPASVTVWNPATGSTETIARDPGATAVTPDGVVVTCSSTAEGLSLTRLDLQSRAERSVQVDPPGSPEARPATCLSMVASPDGAVAVVDDGTLAVDLRTGDATALTGPSGDYLPYPVAVVADGHRYLTVLTGRTQVVLTDVPTDSDFQVGLPDDQFLSDVVPATQLTPDGDHVVSVANDGHDLVVSRTPADGTDFEIVARVDRPAPHRLPGLLDLAINRSSSLVADRVADDRVEVRRLPDLDLVTEVTTPPVPLPANPDERETAAARLGVAFHGDRLVTTTSGTAQWWDPSTGELVDDLDLVDSGLVDQDDIGSGEVGIMLHPDPSLVAVTVGGDTELHIVDIDTGHQVDTIPVGPDVLAANFHPNGDHVALYRRGGILEVWDLDDQQPVIGPLTGYESEVAGFVPSFLEGTDQFFVAYGGGFLGRDGTLRWFQAGSSLPERALDLPIGDSLTGQVPLDASSDASVLLSTSSPASGSRLDAVVTAIRLDPQAWQDKLCDVIDGRTFTDEEVAGVLDGHEPHSLC